MQPTNTPRANTVSLPCSLHPDSNIVTICTIRDCSMGNLLCPECIIHHPEHAVEHKSALQLLQGFLSKPLCLSADKLLAQKSLHEKLQIIESQTKSLAEELNMRIEEEFSRIDQELLAISTQLKKYLYTRILSNENGTFSTIKQEIQRLKVQKSPKSLEKRPFADQKDPEALKRSILETINESSREDEGLCKTIVEIERIFQNGKASKEIQEEVVESVNFILVEIQSQFADLFKRCSLVCHEKSMTTDSHPLTYCQVSLVPADRTSGSTNDNCDSLSSNSCQPRHEEPQSFDVGFPPSNNKRATPQAMTTKFRYNPEIVDKPLEMFGVTLFQEENEESGKRDTSSFENDEECVLYFKETQPSKRSTINGDQNMNVRLRAQVENIINTHPRTTIIKTLIKDFLLENSIFEINDGRYLVGTEDCLKNGGIALIVEETGQLYYGNQVDLERNNRGILFTSEGDMYEGDWARDKLCGFGKYESADGEIVYEGGFYDSQREGEGKETRMDGTIYEGEFSKGLKHGKGVYRWANGETYEGEFFENRIEGTGTYHWQDGTLYKGQWKDNMMHGKGLLVEQHGGRYLGDFNMDLKDGYGIYHWNDGWSYRGDWVEGYQDGIGVEIDPQKEQRVGQWERGTLIKWLV